jgi:replicative DNA helicase
LARLAEAAVTIINAEHYGRTIHDLHLRRELITIGQDVVTEAFRHDLDDPAVEQIERAEQKLFELATTGEAEGGFRPFVSALAQAIDLAQAAFKRDGKTVGVATGFTLISTRNWAGCTLRSAIPRRPPVDGEDRARHQHRVQRGEILSQHART